MPNELDQLASLELANPASWWPLALGYYLVFFALLSLLAITVLIVRYHRKHKNRRIARAQFKRDQHKFWPHDNHGFLCAFNRNIRWCYQQQTQLAAPDVKVLTQWLLAQSPHFVSCNEPDLLFGHYKANYQTQLNLKDFEIIMFEVSKAC